MPYNVVDTPIPVKFSPEEMTRLERHVDEQLEALLRSHRQLFTNDYPEMRRLYEGIPKNRERNFPWKNASNLVVQIIGTYSDMLLARVLAGVWEISPLWTLELCGDWPTEERGEEKRAVVEEFLGNMGATQDELDLYRVEYDFFHDIIKYGFQVVKHPWEVRTEEIVLGVDANGNINSKQEIIYEGPRPFKIPYDKFLIPATAKNWADVNFKAHIVTLTKFDLEKRKYQEVYDKAEVDKILGKPDRQGPSQGDLKIQQQQNSMGQGTAPASGPEAAEWDVYECWFPFISNDKLFRIIYTYHKATKTTLRAVFNFYPKNDEPFTPGRLGYEGDTIRGRGFVNMLKGYQQEISQMHNSGNDSDTLANTSVFRIDPDSKLDAFFSIYPSAAIPARDGEFEVMQMGRPNPYNIEREKLALELTDKRAGVAPPTQGTGGGISNPKKGGFSAMGTFAVMQEGNRRTNINISDMKLAHARMGSSFLKYYSFFGVRDEVRKVYGDRAKDLEAALEAVKEGKMRMPVRSSTASVNKEMEKQGDMLLLGVARQHYQWVGSVLQNLPTAPDHMKDYIVNTIMAGDLLMRNLFRNFGHDDIGRFIPESAFIKELRENAGKRAAASGGSGSQQPNGGGAEAIQSQVPGNSADAVLQNSDAAQSQASGLAQIGRGQGIQ